MDKRNKQKRLPRVSLIPLGGVTEIGKNMLVVESAKDLILVDAGVKFPEEDLLGIDLVIPDISYVLQKKNKLRAVVLTHGHEDHIGALPFILKKLEVPIYGTKLTLGLVERKLEEYGLMSAADLREIQPGTGIKLGSFEVEFFRVNHSIPDGVGLAIQTPAGLIVHSGDFKIDQTPIDSKVYDFARLSEYGKRGVLALICDTTNVERPGYTPSERVVGETFNEVFAKAKQRIIVATFASNVHRIQQIVNSAKLYNRQIAVVGRSMVNVVEVARRLGYLDIPDKMLVSIDKVDDLPGDQLVIITTGSQGEPMAALTRMASHSHRHISIFPGDTVVISATPIPGNEYLVSQTINKLFKLGAEVVYKEVALVHVSGHAAQEELKLVLNILKPQFAIPFHGEYAHQNRFARLAETVGISRDRVIFASIGNKLNFTKEGFQKAEKVPSGSVFVDGLGIGDVGNIVLRDRKYLSQDGVVVVVITINKSTATIEAGPDLISRGFVFVREAGELLAEAKEAILEALKYCEEQKVTEWALIKASIKDVLGEFFYVKTKRRPVILPIIMEI